MSKCAESIFVLVLAAITWSCALSLQRPPPRYSQQFMPQTSFTCRNKIVGSYYADPETDCQLFHVCVSVAGSIQDYRFLCPNDTAFDQESQTCADWYDVDCEAATLYYASDNFDLYRIGSGFESLSYDSNRGDFEPQDNLQRSESSDPIRSPFNSFTSNNNKNLDNTKINKNSNVQINNDNQNSSRIQKHPKNESEKEKFQEAEKKANFRKVNRKPSTFTNVYSTKVTTIAPSQTENRYNNQNLVYSSMTTSRTAFQSLNAQKTNQEIISTPRAPSKFTTPFPIITTTKAKSTVTPSSSYTNYYQTTTSKQNYNNNNYNSFNQFETNAKSNSSSISSRHLESPSYLNQYNQDVPSSTKQPGIDYQQQNQANNYEQRHNNANHNNNNNKNNVIYSNHNYNNVQKINASSYLTTTAAGVTYVNHNYNANYDNYELQKKIVESSQNIYVPTTYSPVTKLLPNVRQSSNKSTYFTTKSTQYTDTDFTKTVKKFPNVKTYQSYDTSTKSYDFGRSSSVGLGFSPSSINYLAENIKSTTPTSRRAAQPTTYNPNNFNVNTDAVETHVTQQKSTYYQNQVTKQHTSTGKYLKDTTLHPKTSKKNDYDYAYYDNGPIEYDNLELEHVGGNKESVKII